MHSCKIHLPRVIYFCCMHFVSAVTFASVCVCVNNARKFTRVQMHECKFVFVLLSLTDAIIIDKSLHIFYRWREKTKNKTKNLYKLYPVPVVVVAVVFVDLHLNYVNILGIIVVG